MNAQYLQSKFDAALSWDDYLATDAEKGARWREIYDQIELTGAQHALVGGFTRDVRILGVSGRIADQMAITLRSFCVTF